LKRKASGGERRDADPCKVGERNGGNKDVMAGSGETASALLQMWQLAEAILPGEAPIETRSYPHINLGTGPSGYEERSCQVADKDGLGHVL
jgi:hypothetical protein